MRTLGLFLQTTVCLVLTCAAAARAGVPQDPNWEIPEALLGFDELQYEQDLARVHAAQPSASGHHAWAILGRQESQAHLDLGIYYYNQKQYDLAAAEYAKSLKLNPQDASAHFNLGILHFDRKEFEAAKREYQEALRLDPTFSPAFNNLGTLHLVQKDYDEAELAFQNALKLNPQDLKAHVNLGHIYFYVRRNYLAAREQYQLALQLNPQLSLARANLETIKKDQIKAREAEHRFKKDLDRKPQAASPQDEIFGPDPPADPARDPAPGGLFEF